MRFLDYVRVIGSQAFGRQRLARTPEPSQVTDDSGHVLEYDRALTTKIVLMYAAALLLLHRTRPAGRGGRALDLACGPGHFSLCLVRHLGMDSVTGLDLSDPMIAAARRSAEEAGLGSRASFRVGDALRLSDVPAASVDLATFTGAAHHLPDLDDVRRVLSEMERVTRPEGLVFVMDAARLRTRAGTDRYVRTITEGYVERGLSNFLEDFRDSMDAAWTVAEMRGIVPRGSDRRWVQVYPRWLPTLQVFLGLPVGRHRPFVRRGVPWERGACPVPRDMRWEWRMLRLSLMLGSRVPLPCGAPGPSLDDGPRGR